jgi:hypothetical protein
MTLEFKKMLWELRRPRAGILALTYVLTLLSAAGSVLTLITESSSPILRILSYVLYAVAAISLSYSVYTVVIYAPSLKRRTVTLVRSNRLTRELLDNYGFRTLINSTVAVLTGVFYGVFNGVLAIMSHSVWYGALAGYYIFLAALRGGIFIHYRKRSGDTLSGARTHRRTGILLIVMNLALSAAIAEMIFSDKSFEYAGLMIYVAATYAFYKVTMSVIRLVRRRGRGDLARQAVIAISLTDAAVSILALQTALLHTFATGEVDVSLFNTLTGSAVSLLTLSLGIVMTVRATKKIKEIKNEGK